MLLSCQTSVCNAAKCARLHCCLRVFHQSFVKFKYLKYTNFILSTLLSLKNFLIRVSRQNKNFWYIFYEIFTFIADRVVSKEWLLEELENQIKLSSDITAVILFVFNILKNKERYHYY